MFRRLHILPIVQASLADYPRWMSRCCCSTASSPMSTRASISGCGSRICRIPACRRSWSGMCSGSAAPAPPTIEANGAPRRIQDLGRHAIIATTGVRPVADRWSFERGGEDGLGRRPAAPGGELGPGGARCRDRRRRDRRLLSYQSAIPEAAGGLGAGAWRTSRSRRSRSTSSTPPAASRLEGPAVHRPGGRHAAEKFGTSLLTEVTDYIFCH